MKFRLKAWMSLALVALVALACGPLDDVRDTADTVDDGVRLLQEIDSSGTWEYLTDGLEALHDSGESYTAALNLSTGTGDDSAVAVFRVDAVGNAMLQFDQGGETREYLVLGYGTPDQPPQVYRVTDGRYACNQDSEDAYLWRGDLLGPFEEFAVRAIGVQTLSVVEKHDDELEVAGREATGYTIESRVEKALEILKELENPDLQQRIDQVGAFELSGGIVLDQETGALLRFESVYRDPGDEPASSFSFEITQWGAVADIPLPAPAQIEPACS